MIHDILHHCRRAVVRVSNVISKCIPKDKELILFSAWFGKKYLDSSRFVFEYCLRHKKFKPYWFARDKELYLELKNKNIPVVYSRSFMGIYYQLRSIMKVSSVQLADFPSYFLGGSIYLDLGHGFAIKQSGFEQPDTTERSIKYTLLVRSYVHYFMSSASTWSKENTKRAFRISDDQLVFCNKPRTDVLFDPELREGKNEIVDKLKAGRKAVVYMPTQRYLGKVKMCMDELLDLSNIQTICEKHNCVFLIKKHFYHRNEVEHLEQYPNIFDITSEDVDPETLTYQADVMISDYSASYIDFLLLDRPVIFYAYDLEDFLKNERDMYLKFEDIHAGYKPQTKEELNKALEAVCATWSDDAHREGRLDIRHKYFDDDVPIGNAREEIVKIMHQLIDGTYVSKWRTKQ